MGNKLSCSCAPLIRKAYRYEDTPWQTTGRRDGHLLRLWAEVFHVSGQGTVKWQQVSEDLVPVNITCIQDTPECVFHITAYNSQVDKILDVRLVQPGTRIGQASECFVYWKDPATGDTWGLNFTSPIDAKQFRECCSPSFKFSRKASSSYSLKLEPPKVKSKRKPLSTPSSPSRIREPQCTCMTQENLQRVRAEHRGRVTGAATLPRVQTRAGDDPSKQYYDGAASGGRAVPTGSAVSSNATAAYDGIAGGGGRRGEPGAVKQTRSEVNLLKRELSQDGPQGRGGSGGRGVLRKEAKSIDYSDMESIRESPLTRSTMGGGGGGGGTSTRRGKSKSTDDMLERLSLDSTTLKRMLRPMASADSPHGSPMDSSLYRPYHSSLRHAVPTSKSAQEISFRRGSSLEHPQPQRGGRLYMDMNDEDQQSPPSDHVLFDNQMYATTPSSSNGNGDDGSSGGGGGGHAPTPNSPTSRLLMEYELHLRNTLARGMDAESYSLHTFEALLTQSMENLELVTWNSECTEFSEILNFLFLQTLIAEVQFEALQLEGAVARNKVDILNELNRNRLLARTSPLSKSSTLPLAHSKSGGFHTSSASILSTHSHSHEMVQQASLDSTDSRLCYLTSSEISDDDRMSLTTAVSDEEDVEGSSHNSPYKSRTSSASSAFNCTGAVRKAGFLSVKKWLLRKKHQVELARKRGWKGYWVCLKGTTLLFYPCDNRDGRAIDNTPKHLIIVDGAIMQPIPEHPKREYIFCLSTAFGDAYLFQAPCQVELENWVNSIHSACAAAFARHRGKTGTLHLLQEEIYRLEKEIESDNKMKHMADLQLTVVSDAENRQTIVNQITQWEENLERLHCEQFRLRCYMASLQNSELPNPKNLLSHVSRNTKTTLNRLGVFTVSSFHAFVCARSPSLLNNLLAGRGATKRRAPAVLSRSNSGSSRRSLSVGGGTGDLPSITEKMVKVILPDNQTTSVYVRDNMTVEEFLLIACSKKQLLASDHFVRLKRSQDSDDHYVPHRNDLIENHTYESAEICAKILYQVELSRSTLDQMWGFSVEAELVENADRQDELCVMVSRVEDRSLAMQQGIIKSDEIMVINGAIVSDLDMMYIESVLQEELLLCMMMRSCRTEPPDFVNIMKTTDEFIEQLVCPPPPSDSALSEEMISGLIVPAPSWTQEKVSPDMESMPSMILTTSSQEIHPKPSSEQIENLLKLRPAVHQSSPSLFSLSAECHPLTAEQVTEYCRSPSLERRKSSGTPPPPGSTGMTPATSATLLPIAPSRQLTDAEKLRKVISELVDTEKTYVEHLNNLLENYLEPLKQETFLSSAEISALFGNIQEIVTFQRVFLLSLEKAVKKEIDLEHFTQPNQFKAVVIALGESFLRYANHFKLYSSFCASHSKAQKVLHPSEGNQMLQEFLQARNPRQQHSSTLESYLIKPIQRILKYPLLLQQMKYLTDPNSEEHKKLAGALKEMEKVAEHINEMQRIHEEYGAIFDHLYRQHLKSSKQHVDLSPGELLYYGGVEWLNISDFLGKIKKGLELHAMCFVFKSAVVFLCKERIRQKKKLMGGSSKSNHAEVEIIRYQVLIPVTEVQVRASTMKDVESHFMWELIHLKSQIQRRSEKVYHLSNSTSDFRNAFLKTIRQIIRESVRNMNIPATKPLSKDKYGHYRKPGDSVSRTLSNKKKGQRGPQRHSAGNIDNDLETYDNVDFASRGGGKHLDDMSGGSAKDLSDSKSDVSKDLKDSQSDKSDKSDKDVSSKPTLGRTPNHLSLSTTSTLSTGSTGSTAAKLIQASNAPSSYQPPHTGKALGSPVWKPRDAFSERSPMPGPTTKEQEGVREHYLVYEDYGGAAVYMTPPTAKKKDHSAANTIHSTITTTTPLATISGSSKHSDC